MVLVVFENKIKVSKILKFFRNYMWDFILYRGEVYGIRALIKYF